MFSIQSYKKQVYNTAYYYYVCCMDNTHRYTLSKKHVKHPLYGVGVALVTPFNSKNTSSVNEINKKNVVYDTASLDFRNNFKHNEYNIDFDSLKKVILHIVKGGASYIVVHGTTGESTTTSIDEKKKVLIFVQEQISKYKDISIVLGVGGNNTKEIIKTLKQYDLTNVEAILSVCPYYNKPTQNGIYEHYACIADESIVPIILYNVPSRTGVNINVDTVLKLAGHSNVIGIKESCGDIDQYAKIAKYKPKDFLLISGNDIDTMSIMSLGGCGVISVLGNAFPKHMLDIVESCFNNEYNKAKKSLFDILELNDLLYKEGNPVGIKQLLELMWLTKPYVRLPLVQAAEKSKYALDEALRDIDKYIHAR